MSSKFDLDKLQEKVEVWTTKNFGTPEERKSVSYHPVLGAMEELGELSHAHLKREQGIRGSAEEHIAKAKDAVGDTIIYLIDYCNINGWNLAEILEQTWDHVEKRDWTKERNQMLKERQDSIKDVDLFESVEEWNPEDCKVSGFCYCQSCDE